MTDFENPSGITTLDAQSAERKYDILSEEMSIAVALEHRVVRITSAMALRMHNTRVNLNGILCLVSRKRNDVG